MNYSSPAARNIISGEDPIVVIQPPVRTKKRMDTMNQLASSAHEDNLDSSAKQPVSAATKVTNPQSIMKRAQTFKDTKAQQVVNGNNPGSKTNIPAQNDIVDEPQILTKQDKIDQLRNKFVRNTRRMSERQKTTVVQKTNTAAPKGLLVILIEKLRAWFQNQWRILQRRFRKTKKKQTAEKVKEPSVTTSATSAHKNRKAKDAIVSEEENENNDSVGQESSMTNTTTKQSESLKQRKRLTTAPSKEQAKQNKEIDELDEVIAQLPREMLIEKAYRHLIDGLLYRTVRHDLDRQNGEMQKVVLTVWRIKNSSLWNDFLLFLGWVYILMSFFEPANRNDSSLEDGQFQIMVGIEAAIMLLQTSDLVMEVLANATKAKATVLMTLFAHKKNFFRLVFFVLNLVDLIVYVSMYPVNSMRFARVIRPLQIIIFSKELRRDFKGIVNSAKNLIMILFFDVIITFFWAYIGVNIIGDLYDDPELDTYAVDFRDFLKAANELYIFSSLDQYPDILFPAIESSMYYLLYFLPYLVLFLLLFAPIPVAVVYDGFRKHRLNILIADRIKRRKALWACFKCIVSNQKKSFIGKSDFLAFFRHVYEKIEYEEQAELLSEVLWQELDVNENAKISIEEFFNVIDITEQRSEFRLQRMKPFKWWEDFREFVHDKVDLYSFIESKAFQFTSHLVTICSCVITVMSLFMDDDSEVFTYTDQIEIAFFVFFSGEIVIKVVAMGITEFRADTWNMFDLSLVLFQAFFDFIFQDILAGSNVKSLSASRVLKIAKLQKIFRMFRAFRTVKILRFIFSGLDVIHKVYEMLYKIVICVPIVMKLSVICVIVFYIYAAIGVELFAQNLYEITEFSPYGQQQCAPYTQADDFTYCEYSSFDSFGGALLILLQVCVGSGWGYLQFDYGRKFDDLTLSIFYFNSFHFLSVFVLSLIGGLVWEVFDVVERIMRDQQAYEQQMELQRQWEEQQLLLEGSFQSGLGNSFAPNTSTIDQDRRPPLSKIDSRKSTVKPSSRFSSIAMMKMPSMASKFRQATHVEFNYEEDEDDDDEYQFENQEVSSSMPSFGHSLPSRKKSKKSMTALTLKKQSTSNNNNNNNNNNNSNKRVSINLADTLTNGMLETRPALQQSMQFSSEANELHPLATVPIPEDTNDQKDSGDSSNSSADSESDDSWTDESNSPINLSVDQVNRMDGLTPDANGSSPMNAHHSKAGSLSSAVTSSVSTNKVKSLIGTETNREDAYRDLNDNEEQLPQPPSIFVKVYPMNSNSNSPKKINAQSGIELVHLPKSRVADFKKAKQQHSSPQKTSQQSSSPTLSAIASVTAAQKISSTSTTPKNKERVKTKKKKNKKEKSQVTEGLPDEMQNPKCLIDTSSVSQRERSQVILYQDSFKLSTLDQFFAKRDVMMDLPLVSATAGIDDQQVASVEAAGMNALGVARTVSHSPSDFHVINEVEEEEYDQQHRSHRSQKSNHSYEVKDDDDIITPKSPNNRAADQGQLQDKQMGGSSSPERQVRMFASHRNVVGEQGQNKQQQQQEPTTKQYSKSAHKNDSCVNEIKHSDRNSDQVDLFKSQKKKTILSSQPLANKRIEDSRDSVTEHMISVNRIDSSHSLGESNQLLFSHNQISFLEQQNGHHHMEDSSKAKITSGELPFSPDLLLMQSRERVIDVSDIQLLQDSSNLNNSSVELAQSLPLAKYLPSRNIREDIRRRRQLQMQIKANGNSPIKFSKKQKKRPMLITDDEDDEQVYKQFENHNHIQFEQELSPIFRKKSINFNRTDKNGGDDVASQEQQQYVRPAGDFSSPFSDGMGQQRIGFIGEEIMSSTSFFEGNQANEKSLESDGRQQADSHGDHDDDHGMKECFEEQDAEKYVGLQEQEEDNAEEKAEVEEFLDGFIKEKEIQVDMGMMMSMMEEEDDNKNENKLEDIEDPSRKQNREKRLERRVEKQRQREKSRQEVERYYVDSLVEVHVQVTQQMMGKQKSMFTGGANAAAIAAAAAAANGQQNEFKSIQRELIKDVPKDKLMQTHFMNINQDLRQKQSFQLKIDLGNMNYIINKAILQQINHEKIQSIELRHFRQMYGSQFEDLLDEYILPLWNQQAKILFHLGNVFKFDNVPIEQFVQLFCCLELQISALLMNKFSTFKIIFEDQDKTWFTINYVQESYLLQEVGQDGPWQYFDTIFGSNSSTTTPINRDPKQLWKHRNIYQTQDQPAHIRRSAKRFFRSSQEISNNCYFHKLQMNQKRSDVIYIPLTSDAPQMIQRKALDLLSFNEPAQPEYITKNDLRLEQVPVISKALVVVHLFDNPLSKDRKRQFNTKNINIEEAMIQEDIYSRDAINQTLNYTYSIEFLKDIKSMLNVHKDSLFTKMTQFYFHRACFERNFSNMSKVPFE